MATSETTRTAFKGRRSLRFALAFVLGAKLALLAQGEGPALAIGAGGSSAPGAPTVGAALAANGTGAAGSALPKAAPGAIVRPDVRALLESLERRQAELDTRERELASKEERLALYEKDVTAKVASLEEIEKRLSARATAATQAVDAAAESLAKIYGGMKPEAAAPILDRLDDPTVLTIFRRMKEKQVGEILPLMTRERAIALTQALAERQ
jgi:flagellar motility protein MotE (MotC chaperone)